MISSVKNRMFFIKLYFIFPLPNCFYHIGTQLGVFQVTCEERIHFASVHTFLGALVSTSSIFSLAAMNYGTIRYVELWAQRISLVF